MRPIRPLAAIAMVAMSCAAGSAQAQAQAPVASAGELMLELNTQADVDNSCRLSFVAFNGTTVALDEISYEAVVFDADKRIAQFVLLEFGKLPVQKTKIVRFDIRDLKCAGISRIVINNAAKCVSKGASLDLCLDAVKPTSRTEITLGL